MKFGLSFVNYFIANTPVNLWLPAPQEGHFWEVLIFLTY
jgi:hypothetical protein